MRTPILPFDRDQYTAECEKCGLMAPYQITHVIRPEGWGATTATMEQWRRQYSTLYRHDPPTTGRDEWLVLTCSHCGNVREMNTADRS